MPRSLNREIVRQLRVQTIRRKMEFCAPINDAIVKVIDPDALYDFSRKLRTPQAIERAVDRAIWKAEGGRSWSWLR